MDIGLLKVHNASSTYLAKKHKYHAQGTARAWQTWTGHPVSRRAADLPRSQLTTIPHLNNTLATTTHAPTMAEATSMFLRMTQQKHESSAYVKSDGTELSTGWAQATPATSPTTSPRENNEGAEGGSQRYPASLKARRTPASACAKATLNTTSARQQPGREPLTALATSLWPSTTNQVLA